MSDYTPDYGRRIVVDLDFEATLGAVSRALRDEGLFALARIDVRDHFMRERRQMFRQYEIIEAWSPDVAVETLSHHLEAGIALTTRIAVYEVGDRVTAVLVSEPLSPMAAHPQWRADFPELAAAADRESGRVARVLDRVQHHSSTLHTAATT